MVKSRTVKTLAVLVASLTLGTAVLLWMETAPAQTLEPLAPPPLIAAASPPRPSLSLGSHLAEGKWQSIFVHDTGHDGAGIVEGCHFLIHSDGAILATARWQAQADGQHIHVPGHTYNAEGVGIALLADCRLAAPTPAQARALGELVRNLQLALRIPPERVYTHADLGPPTCPGRAFDAAAFRAGLLDPSRR